MKVTKVDAVYENNAHHKDIWGDLLSSVPIVTELRRSKHVVLIP